MKTEEQELTVTHKVIDVDGFYNGSAFFTGTRDECLKFICDRGDPYLTFKPIIERAVQLEESGTQVDMKRTYNALQIAHSNGLLTEVVLWSLYALRNSPDTSIEDALNHGLSEWVK